MSSVLITFLGRTPQTEGSYRHTVYDFEDGSEQQDLAFFGWALQQRVKPDRLVILGTAGSMWDHLFEKDINLGELEEENRLALVEAVENSQVSQELLDTLAPLLCQHLDCDVQLKLIPYCREKNEQVELLRILAQAVDPEDEAHLDITHAFRHLPMIAVLGALYLRLTRRINIKRIWYGAFDPDQGSATVHDLAGLLRIADWVAALTSFDKDGDYGVFANLLPEVQGQQLEEAAFFEQVNRLGQARGKARSALRQLHQEHFADPAAELFREALAERLSWTEQNSFYQRQRTLACHSLQQGKFLEAVLNGYEAFITRLVARQNLDPDNAVHREDAREQFDRAEKQISPRSPRYKAWDDLRRLRNAMVHGGQPKGADVQRALSNRAEMKKLLERLFGTLLPES